MSEARKKGKKVPKKRRAACFAGHDLVAELPPGGEPAPKLSVRLRKIAMS
jgi:hypothetical protein